MKTPFVCAALAVTLLALFPAPALAQDEAEHRQLFEKARDAMQAKRWADAHQIFLSLWEKRRTYDVALHLGQIEYHLRRFHDAATHLAYGLVLLPPREKPEIAERSRAMLELCKQEIGTLELSVKNKNATVLVDGTEVADAPLVTDTYVEAGKHQFEVRLNGHASERWESEFAKGSKQLRIVQLKPLSPAIAPAATAADPEAPTASGSLHPSSASRSPSTPTSDNGSNGEWVPVFVGSALTIVGLGSAIAFQMLRNTRDDQATDLRNRIEESTRTTNSCSASDASVETLRLCSQLQYRNNDYDTYGKFELASFALAGTALLATTTYFLVTRPDRATNDQAQSASLVHVVPLIDHTSAGLVVSGRF